MQRGITRLDKGFIGSKLYRVDFFAGAINDGEGRMRIRRRRAKARIVLDAGDLTGLLHGIEVGASIGYHLLWRTAKGAPCLVGPVDHSDIDDRGDIFIDPKSLQVMSGLCTLLSCHTDIVGLSNVCCSWATGINITQAVNRSTFFIG